ncbi:hypothetical protein [Candidatus Kryptobacter tengchongensis]|nr:hypothetical protein [Candidatus Kryptobacter tengchongensis]
MFPAKSKSVKSLVTVISNGFAFSSALKRSSISTNFLVVSKPEYFTI